MPIHATEEPDYQVVRELAGSAVRQYAAYMVAEVVVAGPAGDTGKQAFPILAGYIFGKNKGEKKFAMTAPVTQTVSPGGFLVQFVSPKGVTMTSAPELLDARIQLLNRGGGVLALRRAFRALVHAAQRDLTAYGYRRLNHWPAVAATRLRSSPVRPIPSARAAGSSSPAPGMCCRALQRCSPVHQRLTASGCRRTDAGSPSDVQH